MLTSGQPCNFFDKNQNFYGSSYIYKVSYPLHNFFLKKLAQANLDTMVKYPLPGIGLSIFYLLSLFLLNCEKIINPFHVSVSKQCANYSSCYNVCGPIGVEGVQTYNEEKE